MCLLLLLCRARLLVSLSCTQSGLQSSVGALKAGGLELQKVTSGLEKFSLSLSFFRPARDSPGLSCGPEGGPKNCWPSESPKAHQFACVAKRDAIGNFANLAQKLAQSGPVARNGPAGKPMRLVLRSVPQKRLLSPVSVSGRWAVVSACWCLRRARVNWIEHCVCDVRS